MKYNNIKINNSKSSGQVMTEYLIASGFLAVVVWFSVVGGGVDNNGDPINTPGIVEVLQTQQVEFEQGIYKP